jgi:hypothetical protein
MFARRRLVMQKQHVLEGSDDDFTLEENSGEETHQQHVHGKHIKSGVLQPVDNNKLRSKESEGSSKLTTRNKRKVCSNFSCVPELSPVGKHVYTCPQCIWCLLFNHLADCECIVDH